MRSSMRNSYIILLGCLLLLLQAGTPVLAQDLSSSTPQLRSSFVQPKQPELMVRAIAVEGLVHVPDQVVMSVVSHTIVGEPFDSDKVRDDLGAIMELGYFSDVEAKLYAEGDGVKVVFIPVENEVVRRIVIETDVLEPAILRGYFSQKDNEILNHNQLSADLVALQDSVIDDHGYVVRPADVNLVDGELQIKIAAAKVAEIVIEGNTKTKDIVIRREFSVKPGDDLNMHRLSRDLQRIWQLGYFDDIVPEFYQAEEPDAIKIVVGVTERKTGAAIFGAGYSSLDGLLGYVEYSDENFLGRGEALKSRIEFGQRKLSYDFSFYEPYLMGSRTSFGINIYNRYFDRTEALETGDEDYKEHRRGGDLSIGRPLGDYTRGQITLKLENTSIVPEEEGTIPQEETHTRSLIFTTDTDTTDYPFYPLSGMRANFSVEVASKWLGGDTQFVKYRASTSRYFKVGRADQVLAFRLAGGIGEGALPNHERFAIGGGETVRGYKPGEMQGDRMFYLNGEYRFKLTKALQAALFVDVGQAWNKDDGFPDSVKIGYGAGLRLDTPLGIMRLDYGIGEQGGRFTFGIGPSF
ncbi:MAG: BamA/OMP85 family outer membrane protein [Limnochordia bacterium]|jgi:outer membrane protein insertion porin family